MQPDAAAAIVLHIQVGAVGGAHQHGVAGRLGGLGVLGVGPELYHGAGGQGSGSDLVPADRRLAGLPHDVLHSVDEADVVFVVRRVTFIAAQVEVGAGGQGRQLFHYVFDEDVHGVLIYIKGAKAHAGPGIGFDLRTVHVQDRVGRKRRVRMSRHVDLGYDGDAPGGGVVDQRGILLLGVASTCGPAHLRGCSYFRKSGVTLDLDAPALVVTEVQMQMVDLVGSDAVDDLLDLFDRKKVPRHVQHEAAVGVACLVLDAALGDVHRTGVRPREVKHLLEGFCGVEHAVAVAG